MLSIANVKSLFEREFSSLSDKFNIFELSINEANKNGSEEINSSGFYIFWHPAHGVIKVGKSQYNSKKRSLEHIRDNTLNKTIEMASLKEDQKTKLLLLNIVNPDNNLHWILSLEAFMAWSVKPEIKAGRTG